MLGRERERERGRNLNMQCFAEQHVMIHVSFWLVAALDNITVYVLHTNIVGGKGHYGRATELV